MKLTTESSASLFSYLPLTSNILLTILPSQNPQSVFFSWHNNKFHTQTIWQEQFQFYSSVHATFWTEW